MIRRMRGGDMTESISGSASGAAIVLSGLKASLGDTNNTESDEEDENDDESSEENHNESSEENDNENDKESGAQPPWYKFWGGRRTRSTAKKTQRRKRSTRNNKRKSFSKRK